MLQPTAWPLGLILVCSFVSAVGSEHLPNNRLLADAGIREAPQADIRYLERQWQTARESFEKGEQQRRSGQFSDALTSFRVAEEIIRKISDAVPSNEKWTRDLAATLIKIGDVQMGLRRHQEAESTYRDAMTINELLMAEQPNNTEWKRNQHVLHNKIGDLFQGRREHNKALAEYRLAVNAIEPLALEHPNDKQFLEDLATTFGRVGNAHLGLDQPADAVAVYTRSLLIRKKLSQEFPGDLSSSRSLATIHGSLATALINKGSLEAARHHLEAGKAVLENVRSKQLPGLAIESDIRWFDERLQALAN